MSRDIFIEKIHRGQVLRQQGRYGDAEEMFRDAVSADPENAAGYAELAFCQIQMEGKRREALQTIDRAIQLDPNVSDFYALKAMALAVLDRGKDALPFADQAIGLDPENGWAHTTKARAYLSLQQWSNAEASARQALTLDPDDGDAGNILATSLRLQGKLDENTDAVEKLLSDDPDDAFAHCNAGWAALQRHRHQDAERHFREALQIDAELEYARAGLLESYKGRSPFYRMYLRYAFFMQRFQRGSQWAIIIGLYLAFRFGREFFDAIHPLAAMGLTLCYLLFVFWVWVASGVGHFLIFLDRSARVALKQTEVLEGIAVGGGLFLGVILATVGILTGQRPLIYLGVTLLIATIPASLYFTNPSLWGRRLFGGIMVYIYLAGLFALSTSWVSPEARLHKASLGYLMLGLWGSILCTWLGNVSALRKEKVY